MNGGFASAGGGFRSPLQGEDALGKTSNPGWRAQGALTVGYLISRFQRED